MASAPLIDFLQFSIRDLRIAKYFYLCIMRKHNGMRPQDVVILLKIIILDGKSWQNKDLAYSLSISNSEVSESLYRSQIAGLINPEKKKVYRLSFMEFLEFGLPYVFPVNPEGEVNGIPTAHSHPFMKKHFTSSQEYVWPDVKAVRRGASISPLYPGVINAVAHDEQLYKYLALIDVIRVGKIRELKVAITELKKNILNGTLG